MRFKLVVLSLVLGLLLPIFSSGDDLEELTSEDFASSESFGESATLSEEDRVPEVTSRSYSRRKKSTYRVAIIPMIGGGGYVGNWNGIVQTNVAVGLAVEIPVYEQLLSVEVEGSYEQNRPLSDWFPSHCRSRHAESPYINIIGGSLV